MVTLSIGRTAAWSAAAAAALTIASCAPPPPVATPVQASNPRVTYKYNTDDALIEANQKATAFCSQYQALPRTLSISNDINTAGKEVVFECMPRQPVVATIPAPPPPPNPPLAYSYRTDQELLDASRNAQTYCASVGSPRLTSTVTTNAMGVKTVTFQCSPM